MKFSISFCGATAYNQIMYYVYVLQNESDKSLYIGFSSDLKRRLQEHIEGRGGRTTKIKTGWRLIYYEAYIEKLDALGRERFLKGGSGRKYIYKQLNHHFQNLHTSSPIPKDLAPETACQ